MKKIKVAVAMSGGIDSSITALLLQEQGYDLVGITLRVWDYVSEGCEEKETGCCSMEAIFEAQAFAKKIGIPHHIVDVRNSFKDIVVTDFINEYIAGRTPNPCVVCNPAIKWGEVIKKAEELGCDFIATGHYSQIAQLNGRYYFTKAADTSKDQSYVLWKLPQEFIKKTLLPLGKYKKSEIKQLAMERGFEKLAKKRESQEICFIPDDDYRNFLKKRVPHLESSVNGGEFISTTGKHLGTHKGYPFYTIGQRKGLNIALGKPTYVVAIKKDTNQIILGDKGDLLQEKMIVSHINFLKYSQFDENSLYSVKIRYNSTPNICKIRTKDIDTIEVEFVNSVGGITPGQSAVFYEGDDVVAGGIIQ
ncbi:MAG TPA: tRNA 2-thiouridine(34) synthase MnmA [Bacteroidales bacterium]|jgi:tRNA-specific 2-thiouridylase|nr:tRNA 2-thiouridine(34) synthase MnmA [Bacteroidales bacterium]